VVKPDQNVTEKELVDHCTQHLARYEVPTRFAFIKELPKSDVLKTLRRELVRMEMEEREKGK
ncbi:MAG: long-chain fatty acid--CoA ligase, partial [Anaerolineae bacterium]|nr:long-chain fatty acid--CoA ligase [Anaerolineae bacterium]